MTRNPIRTSLMVSAALLGGCSGSGQEKEQQAVARALNRKKPGYVRVLNLSASPAVIEHKGRIVISDTQGGKASFLAPVGAGNQVVDLKVGESTTQVPLELTSDRGTTIVLKPGGGQFSFGGEMRYPFEGQNCRVLFFDETGKRIERGASVKLDGPTPNTADAGKEWISLSLGDYRWAESPAPLQIAPSSSYTLVFIRKSGGGFSGHGMLNTPNNKPIIGSAAQS
jgi:hypothetical protein